MNSLFIFGISLLILIVFYGVNHYIAYRFYQCFQHLFPKVPFLTMTNAFEYRKTVIALM